MDLSWPCHTAGGLRGRTASHSVSGCLRDCRDRRGLTSDNHRHTFSTGYKRNRMQGQEYWKVTSAYICATYPTTIRFSDEILKSRRGYLTLSLQIWKYCMIFPIGSCGHKLRHAFLSCVPSSVAYAAPQFISWRDYKLLSWKCYCLKYLDMVRAKIDKGFKTDVNSLALSKSEWKKKHWWALYV